MAGIFMGQVTDWEQCVIEYAKAVALLQNNPHDNDALLAEAIAWDNLQYERKLHEVHLN